MSIAGPAEAISGTAQRAGGFGDTTVRLKINFIGNDGGKFAIGFVSSLKIPTNSDHLGNNVYEPGFGLPINYSLPGGFTFFAQTRIDILDRAAQRRSARAMEKSDRCFAHDRRQT